jgi:hypothetical protein
LICCQVFDFHLRLYYGVETRRTGGGDETPRLAADDDDDDGHEEAHFLL